VHAGAGRVAGVVRDWLRVRRMASSGDSGELTRRTNMARKNKDVWVAEATKLKIDQARIVNENNETRVKTTNMEHKNDHLRGCLRIWTLRTRIILACQLATFALIIVERIFA